MKKFKLFPLMLLICLIFAIASPAALALDDPQLNAQRALIADLDSGRILYSKNMDQEASPASLTKIMTVLLAVESVERGEHSMDEIVTAKNDCQTGMDTDSSNVGLVSGEEMSFQSLLYCAMVSSGNDACNVIASYMAGDIPTFVEWMNQRAAELGCTATTFVDPNGLSSDDKTTAYDLYLITKEAINHPDFMTICNTSEYTVPATNVNEARELRNSNALISSQSIYGGSKYLYEYAAGVKTGYTRAAGYCLISTAQKDGVRLLAVIMGCDGQYNSDLVDEWKNFSDSIAAYDWVFSNFSYQDILTTEDPIQKVSVELSKNGTQAILHPQTDFSVLLPDDLDKASISTQVTIYEDKLVAPLKAGTVLGEAQVLIDGQSYGTVKLVNGSEIELARGEYFKQQLKAVFSKTWVVALILVVVLLAAVYLILVARYRRARQEHLRRQARLSQQRRTPPEQSAHRPQTPPASSGSDDDFLSDIDWDELLK